MNAAAVKLRPEADVTSSGPAVYSAIASVMAALAQHGIAKDKRNTQGSGYNFRGIDDVYNALSASLAEHQLCIIPRVLSRECVERTSKNGGSLFYTTVDVEFDLISAVDGSKHTARTVGEAMDSGDKSSNKAMSAAYKYMAFQTFCIPTEGDNDADASTHEVERKSPQPSGIFIACKAAIDMCEQDEATLNDWKAKNEKAFSQMSRADFDAVKTYWQTQVKAARAKPKPAPPKDDFGIGDDEIPF